MSWKKELKRLCKDFCISNTIYKNLADQTKQRYKNAATPGFYKGDREAFLYDRAQADLRSILIESL